MSKSGYPVCHLLYEEYPRDPRVRRYVNALNENDEKCIVVCSKKKNDSYFENINGNMIYRLPVSKKRGSFFLTLIEYLLFAWISSVLLLYLQLRYRFKVVHVHTLPDFLIFAALWNKIFGAKLILDLHEIFPELYMARTGAAYDSFKVKLLKFAEKYSIKLADKVITIHDNAKDIFIKRNKLSEEKISVVMNSVDPREFPHPAAPTENEFVIIYNGTIVKLLNLTMIVEALAKLKNELPENDFSKIVFRLYGDGPALDEIQAAAKARGVTDKVQYMGYLQPADMRREVLKTGVLILPPIKNIYSDLFYTIKLIETIYLKIPVIATRLNTYLRYYSEDSLFYFNSGNTAELAERIKEVFYNKELVKNKTLSARADYDKLSWEIMRDRYLKIIQKLTV
ncbi:MAG TPA: glycosyltransferase [Ignavibacteria bacterium]|nr:glycosyltransferase [Ignavibacteria bacterium]